MATTKIPVELSSTPGIVDNSNATAITIDSSENVGIGTATPAKALQVKTDTNGDGVNIQRNSTTADHYGQLSFSVSTNDSYTTPNVWIRGVRGSSYTNNFMTFGTGGNTGTEAMRIDSSGSVGIGTTSPGYPLEVANTATTSIAYQRTGVSAKKWGFDSDNAATYLINLTDNVRAITAYNDGKIGIGTLSPGHALDVVGTGKPAIEATCTAGHFAIEASTPYDYVAKFSSTDSGAAIVLQDNSSTNHANRINVSGNTMQFVTGATTAVTINASQKVGVGITTPNGLLHIGDSNAEGSSANPALQIGGANTYRLGFYTDSEGGIIQNLNGDNGLQFRVKTAGEVMRIMPSGNVGIGETNPDAPLHITSNTPIIAYDESDTSQEFRLGVFGGAFALYDSNDTTFRMLVDGNGKVGIGETAPLGKLHVKSADSGQSAADGTADELVIENSGDSGLSILSGTSNYGTILFGDSGDSAAGRIRYEHSHAALNFGTNGSWNRMWISSTGKVGINTTSPDELLQVELGNIKVEGGQNASTRGLIIAHTGQTGNLTMLRQDSSGSRGILETTERNLRISAGSGGGTGTAETLDFFVNGSERMSIDTTGAIQIGGSTNAGFIDFDSQKLQLNTQRHPNTGTFVNTSRSHASIELNGADGGSSINFRTADSNNTASTVRMTIDDSGRIGIGTTSPHSSAKIHSYVSSTNAYSFYGAGLGGNNFKIVPYTSNGAFSSLTAEDDVVLVAENAGGIVLGHHASGYYGMRIQSTGSVNIGTKTEANGSTGGCTFSADSSNRRNFICATTGSGTLELIEFRNPNGTVGTIKTSGSSTSYATSSDYRLKENVNYTWDATTRLKQLKPARFNFKADADITLDGFLAHEVSSVVPQAISGEKDGEKMQEIDHSKLVPLLVKTIQELEARIKVLEDK